MKIFKTKSFWITFAISVLLFELIEHYLESSGVDLGILKWFGSGSIILVGIKFHLFCCAAPAIVSSIICTSRNHKHCEHNHEK